MKGRRGWRILLPVCVAILCACACVAQAETWLIPWDKNVTLVVGDLHPNTAAFHATWDGSTGGTKYAVDFLENGYRNVALYAPAGGTVICSEGAYVLGAGGCKGGHDAVDPGKREGAFGNHIIFRTDDGEEVIMAHFDSLARAFQPNDRIRRGEYLGILGNSGRSDAPHLHFEVRTWLRTDERPLFGHPKAFFTKDSLLAGGAGEGDAFSIHFENAWFGSSRPVLSGFPDEDAQRAANANVEAFMAYLWETRGGIYEAPDGTQVYRRIWPIRIAKSGDVMFFLFRVTGDEIMSHYDAALSVNMRTGEHTGVNGLFEADYYQFLLEEMTRQYVARSSYAAGWLPENEAMQARITETLHTTWFAADGLWYIPDMAYGLLGDGDLLLTEIPLASANRYINWESDFARALGSFDGDALTGYYVIYEDPDAQW